MKTKEEKAGEFIGAMIVLTLAVAIPLGWCMNLYKLTQCDFEAPYKAEVIRSVGVGVPFVGIVTGYIDIEDGK